MFDNIEITASNLPSLQPLDLRPEADVRVRVPSRVKEGEPSGGVSLETRNGHVCIFSFNFWIVLTLTTLGGWSLLGLKGLFHPLLGPPRLVWLQGRAPTRWYSHCSIYLHGVWEGHLSLFWKAALTSKSNKRHVRSLKGTATVEEEGQTQGSSAPSRPARSQTNLQRILGNHFCKIHSWPRELRNEVWEGY